jgi:MarR family transcriptional regulator, organic hydroperoxide resistance regulator
MALRFLSPIHKATRQIQIYLERLPTGRELSLHEAHLITYVSAYGPCPIGDMNLIFGFRPSTLTSMLDRLEKRDLIRRKLHPRDRRSFLVSPTARGRRMAAKIERNLLDLESKIADRVTATDLKGFARVMTAIGEITEVKLKGKE